MKVLQLSLYPVTADENISQDLLKNCNRRVFCEEIGKGLQEMSSTYYEIFYRTLSFQNDYKNPPGWMNNFNRKSVYICS